MSGRDWTGPEIRKLIIMASEGCWAGEIAEALGRSKNAVYGQARQQGIRLPYHVEDGTGDELPDYCVRGVETLKDAGFSAMQISDIFRKKHRVSPGRIGRICHKEGD